MKKKLFVADYKGYAEPWLGLFVLTDNIKDADCLMLTGGEDINPANYGEKPGSHTYFSNRDRYELAFCQIAQDKNIPIIGICRGAQQLCALAGGKLIQHVSGHHHTHPITTDRGATLSMSSLHHQMMRPEGTDHHLIAWASGLSHTYLNGDDEEIYGQNAHLEHEPEIVFFPKVRGLAIQGHPEMMRRDHPTVAYCNKLAQEYLNV